MSAPKTAVAAYTIAEAAARKSVSAATIRRAIHATEGPVLRAKRVGKTYRISADALDDWWTSLPDA